MSLEGESVEGASPEVDSLDVDRVDANKRAARRLFEEVIQHGRLELLEELVAEDAVDETRDVAGWDEGRAGFDQHVRWLRNVFRDLEVTLRDMVAEGDRVVVFWNVRGVHQGDLWGYPGSGRSVDTEVVSWVRCRHGQIVSYNVLPDTVTLLRQLGALA